ncbi:CDP-glycerol glycerophosphotransferase family protein [Exiguobacterium sp. TDN 0502]|uniref:CDP-glycerol glycerophosphotransferase family protein n=1 Tax=Exiguobacterium sp. TDN 0502 TaxID=3420731 RepID=UPI003D77FDED
MKDQVKQWIKRTGLIERVLKTVMKVLTRLPQKRKRVLFESFLGKQYSDSPRAIYELMRTMHPECELIFSKQRNVTFPPHVKTVDRLSFRWIYLLATSRVWVSNSRLPGWLIKPENTYYLQTWHGTPLKKLALDMDDVQMANTTTERYKQGFKQETAKWSGLISPNAYSSAIFKRAFAFNGDMLEIGYPRNDIFYQTARHDRIKEDVYRHYDIAPTKKVLLYAPTWRDNAFEGQGKYSFELPFSLDQFEERFGDEYVLLVRMHYLVGSRLDVSAYRSVRNASDYPDIAELYIASTALITDYSSVMFDFAHLSRPILFYAYDLEHYRDQLRGFYFDFEQEAPGPLLSSEGALFDELERLDSSSGRYASAFRSFRETYCEWDDGQASERAMDMIVKRIYG